MEELIEKLKRDPESHKGENGKVGIIAGSKDYSGAPALVAKAALRTGCDLTTILTSSSVSSTVASYSENFIVREYDSDFFDKRAVKKALKLDEKVDAVVIGPGLSNPEEDALKEFLANASSPVVVDADALNCLESSGIENAVLTPHSGEFQPLKDSVNELVENNNIVIRKGSTDKLYSDDLETKLDIGDPTMTVGGTGDVLAGVIGSLIAQKLNKKDAAELGLHINGKAGDLAAIEFGNGALATDIIEKIPDAINNLD